MIANQPIIRKMLEYPLKLAAPENAACRMGHVGGLSNLRKNERDFAQLCCPKRAERHLPGQERLGQSAVGPDQFVAVQKKMDIDDLALALLPYSVMTNQLLGRDQNRIRVEACANGR